MLIRTLPVRSSLAGLALLALAGVSHVGANPKAAAAADTKAATAANPKGYNSLSDIVISAVPVGPSQADLDGLKTTLPTLPEVAKFLKDTRFRHIETNVITQDSKDDRPAPADRFEATFYDYTNQRAVIVMGTFANRSQVEVKALKGYQPNPSAEEFAEAVSVLLSDPQLSQALVDGRMYTYGPMPPVLEFDPDTKEKMERRIVNVGVMPKVGYDQVPHQIVGVDLSQQKVQRFSKNAPVTAAANASPNCGVAGAGQSSSGRGSAGTSALTVSVGGETIWEMTVVRPSASSGTRASGIEVRDVKYRGKSVLKRGHVPVLNVLYTAGQCGPYRDWQYQEGQFDTGTGSFTNLTGGNGAIRDIGSFTATTALENGTDVGNFNGVAIYRFAGRENDEVVLITEMEAGWYRYIHEWRFGMDGSIRPRFGFGATTNSCTCLQHDHHVYFRLDVDLNGSANSLYEIQGDPANYVPGSTPRTLITQERSFNRSLTQQPYYLLTGPRRHYLLVTHPTDGIADSYGKADMWVLRYKTGTTVVQQEIDDGYNQVSGSGTAINLDPFFASAPESVNNQDLVIWYHGTVRHSPTTASFMCTPTGLGIPGRNILTGDKVVGPDLLPVPF
ncbi:MAG: hypothetical protein JSR82_00545 [Verrucomicrobia bacterium]|nr:hypothetical protein [Verrucomicrobiota bacterium]